MKNAGKGVANNVKISISNSPNFIEGSYITDFENNFISGEILVFSVSHLPVPQINIIDWTKDLYIKYEGESRYNKNKFTNIYRAEIKELKVVLPINTINFVSSESLFSIQPTSITKEYTENKSEYYIHNITSM